MPRVNEEMKQICYLPPSNGLDDPGVDCHLSNPTVGGSGKTGKPVKPLEALKPAGSDGHLAESGERKCGSPVSPDTEKSPLASPQSRRCSLPQYEYIYIQSSTLSSSPTFSDQPSVKSLKQQQQQNRSVFASKFFE